MILTLIKRFRNYNVTWQTIEPGAKQAVMPNKVVGREEVSYGGSYEFFLKPGTYVLQGLVAGLPALVANQGPWVGITVKAGVVEHIDVPNDCG